MAGGMPQQNFGDADKGEEKRIQRADEYFKTPSKMYQVYKKLDIIDESITPEKFNPDWGEGRKATRRKKDFNHLVEELYSAYMEMKEELAEFERNHKYIPGSWWKLEDGKPVERVFNLPEGVTGNGDIEKRNKEIQKFAKTHTYIEGRWWKTNEYGLPKSPVQEYEAPEFVDVREKDMEPHLKKLRGESKRAYIRACQMLSEAQDRARDSMRDRATKWHGNDSHDSEEE